MELMVTRMLTIEQHKTHVTQFRSFFPKETSDLDSIGFVLKVVKVAAYKTVGDAGEVGRDTQNNIIGSPE